MREETEKVGRGQIVRPGISDQRVLVEPCVLELRYYSMYREVGTGTIRPPLVLKMPLC